jgi:Ca-activated chloride channel family protein
LGQPDYYQILGISRDASQEEIRKAYFSAARRLHPDKNLLPGDTEIFIGANEAYEILSDVKKRANYDAGLPPDKPVHFPVSQRIIFSRDTLLQTQDPQLVYTLLEYLPSIHDLNENPSPPLNLCLLIDHSTSMKGVNLDIVKATSIQILKRIRPQDIFSLVTFSDHAEVLVPYTQDRDLLKFEARIQMLQPSGGTEIYNGLSTAFTEVRRTSAQGYINHIILLTDGRTYGDENKCLELADQAVQKGIGISGLGIGPDWNDSFLEELARRTGGSSFYVSNPQDIKFLLLEKFNNLWETFKEGVTIEFKKTSNVELNYAFRIQPELGQLSVESPLHLGPVLRNGSIKILLEFLVSGTGDANVIKLLDGIVKVNSTLQNKPVSTLPIKLSCPVNRSIINPEPPPDEIIQALSRLSLYKMQAQARLEVAQGNYNEASNRLQKLATNLLQQGDRGLARTVLLEAEQIKEKGSYSPEGEKRIKYGTRALLQPGNGGNKP